MVVGDSLPADFSPHEILGLSMVLKKDTTRIELHTNCDSTTDALIDDVFIFGLDRSIQHLYFKGKLIHYSGDSHLNVILSSQGR